MDVADFGAAEKSVYFLDNAPCTIEQKTASGWEPLPKKAEDAQQHIVKVLTDGHHDLQIHWSAYYGFLDTGTYRVTARVLEGHDPFTFEFEITEEMRAKGQSLIEDILSRKYWHIRQRVEWDDPSLDSQNEFWKYGDDGLYLTYKGENIIMGMMSRGGVKYKLTHEEEDNNAPIIGWMPWPGMDINRLTDWTACLADGRYTQEITYRGDGSVSKAVLTKNQSNFDLDGAAVITLEFLDTPKEEVAETINDQNTNVWQDFSWAEDQKNQAASPVSFVNTTPSPIRTTANVLDLAEKECTVEYNQIMIYRDEFAGIWKVEYQILYGYQGYQYVYLNDEGITVMVSGRGSKVEEWKEAYPGP